LAQIQKIKIPRHFYTNQVANAIRSGSGIQDYLGLLNKDGVEEVFDDFHGDSVGHKFAEVTGTGTATYAASKAVLTTTAADHKTTGLMGNAGWTAGQGCVLETRFAVDRLVNKIFLGWVNAEGGGDEGVLNNSLTPSFRTATSVIGLGYDYDDTSTLKGFAAYSACSTHYDGSTPAATRVSLVGYGAANGSNHAAATTYTVNGTPLLASQLIGQIITVPATASTTVPTRRFMVHSNTTSVATGHWMGNGFKSPDDLSYRWGNGPITTGTPTLNLAVPVAAEYHTYTVKLDPALVAYFYIDGIEMCRLDAAVTASTTSLLPVIECTSRDGTASIMSVDYIRAVQSRRA
jgi:hypothetical protein